MATSTLETLRESAQGEGLRPYWQPKIAGAYRPISVHQLIMWWWLYAESKITARQLRIIFALQEMHERREYLSAGAHRRYALPELRRLIGGGVGGGLTDEALTRDIRRLCRLGVITFDSSRVSFATRVGQLTDSLDLDSFWALFNQLDHPRRTVPVPRRVLRALAGGFSRAVMGTLIAHMIRCLFWHKDGGYRVDGRTKASWVVDLFGISRRAVIDARKKLIELGWLEKLPAEQWEINRWGARFAIRTAGPDVDFEAESAPLTAANTPRICTPMSKQISSPKGELKETRKPTCGGSSGLSGKEGKGSRKKKPSLTKVKPPTIFDIQKVDLEEPARTEALYQDACLRQRARSSEHGRLQFFALVERARAHGQDPARLLAWLLREDKTNFIAHIDEERGVARIKRLDYGIQPPREQASPPRLAEPSGDVRYYGAVIDYARQDGTPLDEAAQAAREHLGWDQERWDQAEIDWWKWQEEKAERWDKRRAS